MKIKIVKGGPYMVMGGIPLNEETIVNDSMGKADKWKEVKKYYPSGSYTLCRCGKSQDKPFCTGDHVNFDGAETAPRNTFESRAKIAAETKDVRLLQDFSLCIGAGFCHNRSYIDKNIKKKETLDEALQQTYDCSGGSLLLIIDGEKKEPKLEKSISSTCGTGKRGPIIVKGGIPVISTDGYVYEVRNRVALCSCGRSKNMPFCDGSHLR